MNARKHGKSPWSTIEGTKTNQQSERLVTHYVLYDEMHVEQCFTNEDAEIAAMENGTQQKRTEQTFTYYKKCKATVVGWGSRMPNAHLQGSNCCKEGEAILKEFRSSRNTLAEVKRNQKERLAWPRTMKSVLLARCCLGKIAGLLGTPA